MDICLPQPRMHDVKNITTTAEIIKLIADIDEFKGRWKAIETLAPEKLTSLRRSVFLRHGAKARSAEQ